MQPPAAPCLFEYEEENEDEHDFEFQASSFLPSIPFPMSHYTHCPAHRDVIERESLRLEAVTVSVGFDDLLDHTLAANHGQVDTMIVVTSHDDRKTQAVARKHGALCVPTDLVKKNGRSFNKGAAINAGFDYFQYHGWRLHIDSDIVLPSDFRRMLFNHHHLDRDCLYGVDRVDIIGLDELDAVRASRQHQHSCIVHARSTSPTSARFISTLHGYCPIGYFQLWHSSCQQPYPYSLGTAAHDDVMFACLWPESQRRLIPGMFVYHLCAAPPQWGENWDGRRKQPRLKR